MYAKQVQNMTTDSAAGPGWVKIVSIFIRYFTYQKQPRYRNFGDMYSDLVSEYSQYYSGTKDMTIPPASGVQRSSFITMA